MLLLMSPLMCFSIIHAAAYIPTDVFQVETDLSFLGGKPVLTVLEGQLGKYELTALPRKRGKFSGVVAFVAGKNPVV